jgi:hypothetical protein
MQGGLGALHFSSYRDLIRLVRPVWQAFVKDYGHERRSGSARTPSEFIVYPGRTCGAGQGAEDNRAEARHRARLPKGQCGAHGWQITRGGERARL